MALQRLVTGLAQPRERRVAVILIAVLNQQVGARLLDPHADDVLAVLLQLEHQAGEVAVTRHQDEGADLRPDEHQLQRVDGQTDVRGVLLRRPVSRREDQIDRCFRERDDVLRIAPPIGIGALHGDLASNHIRVQKVAKFLAEVRPDPHRDVVEIDEQRRL